MTTSPSIPGTNETLAAGAVGEILAYVEREAAASGVFGGVRMSGGAGGAGLLLSCEASGVEGATYRLQSDGGRLWVALVTADRYLSQSIEQDLVHTGDKMHDLLRDELIDADHPNVPSEAEAGKELRVEHFRDSEKLFTFRVAVRASDLAQQEPERSRRVWLLLKAFEAVYRNLGGMQGDGE